MSYLKARGFDVKLMTDDIYVKRVGEILGVRMTSFNKSWGDFDLFLCVHGNKIIPKEYLIEGKFVNIHPCLEKYKGHNPIERYVKNGDTLATVTSHFMTEVVDEGEIIYSNPFYTGKVSSHAEFYNAAVPYYYECIHHTLLKLKIEP